MEAGTKQKDDIRSVGEGGEYKTLEDSRPDDPGRDAVDAVAKGSKDPADLADATAWFMSDEPAPPATKTFGLNVGRFDQEAGKYVDHVVDWTVQAIARERIRQIRKLAQPARQRAMGGGEINDVKANSQIAGEGTVVPDVRNIAASLGTQDVAEVMDRRFAHKPGLIDMIAQEVLTVSGYDDDDVRDASTVRD